MVTRPPFSSPDPELAATEKAGPASSRTKKTVAKKPAPRKVPAKKAAAPPAKKTARKAVAKKAAKRTARTKAPADDSVDAIDPPPKGGWPQPTPGPVEAAVRKELAQAGVSHSALAASAIAMAQNVDRAESPAGASAAARELRIVLPLARTTVNPLSPSAEQKRSRGEAEEQPAEPGPTRLKLVREKAAKRAARAGSA